MIISALPSKTPSLTLFWLNQFSVDTFYRLDCIFFIVLIAAPLRRLLLPQLLYSYLLWTLLPRIGAI